MFCPPGAEWHYSFSAVSMGIPLHWYTDNITYARDSILNNDTVKVLEHYRYYKNCNGGVTIPFTIIKQKGDTVFFRSSITYHKWQILYNFAAQPGDSWRDTIAFLSLLPMNTIYTVTVDSIKNVLVNSFNLRQLYARYTADAYPIEHPVTLTLNTDTVCIDERLGCSEYLFNFYNRKCNTDCGDNFDEFLCYSDDDFGLKQLTDKPCDYSAYVGIAENNAQNSAIKIFPNPTSSLLNISIDGIDRTDSVTMELADITGRIVLQSNIEDSEKNYKADLKDLNNGVYLISLSKNKTVFIKGKF